MKWLNIKKRSVIKKIKMLLKNKEHIQFSVMTSNYTRTLVCIVLGFDYCNY